MMNDIYIKDSQSGRVHRLGTNCHDALRVDGGAIYYENLQNGDGSRYGGYVFCDKDGDALDSKGAMNLGANYIGIGKSLDLRRMQSTSNNDTLFDRLHALATRFLMGNVPHGNTWYDGYTDCQDDILDILADWEEERYEQTKQG